MKTKSATKLRAGDVVRLPGSDRWALIRDSSVAGGELRVSYTFEGDPSETTHRYRSVADAAPAVEVKPAAGAK